MFKVVLRTLVLTAMATVPAAPGLATPQSAGVWHVSRSPKLSVNVAAGCPASIKGYADVANTFPGPPLVPSQPSAGTVCWYRPDLGLGHPARRTRLDAQQANILVTAVRKLSLEKPKEVFHCPASFGTIAVIGFSYPGRADVGLWYSASGCQTLDNGRIGSFQGGNPSFYSGFEVVIDRLSPPVGHP